MPDSGNYSQYNSNAAALLNAHAIQYMEWYLAAVIIYVFTFAVFVGWWFFQNRVVLGAGVVVGVGGASSHVPVCWLQLKGGSR